MNDVEKFVAEWEKRFPQEECPDAGFITSINFMNIRSRISEREAKIKELRSALEKEEFILNWLISLDIEISVTGNVGIISEGMLSPGPSPKPVVAEGERSLNNANLQNDQEENKEVEHTLQESSALGNRKNEMDEDSVNNLMVAESLEGRSETENDAEISPTDGSDNNIKDDRLSTNTPAVSENAEPRSRPRDLSLVTYKEDIQSPGEPEYENIFDLLSIRSSNVETPETGSPSNKDKRRAGGNWGMFIDNKNTENENGEDEEKEAIYDTIPNNIELKTEAVLSKPKTTSGGEKVNVYEEITFPDEVGKKNHFKPSENVTINKLYEPVELQFKRENINTDKEEESGEAIYVNLKELNIPGKMAPVAKIETSDASDYDSDCGKSDDKLQAYRHMTEDEINNLRKWRSDEDLSQLNQDTDDRSCDSDDGSGGRARSGSYISQTSRVESEESTDDQYNGKSGEGSNDNDSHEQHQSDSQNESEEDEETAKCYKMRSYLVKNLLDSENSYFDCLDMIRKYMKPLQKSTETSQPILSKQDYEKIFLGLEELHQIHANLLDQLEKIISLWDSSKTIGDVLTSLIDGFGVYKDYINNYKSSQETFLKCRSNSLFDGIVQKDIKIPSLKDPIKLDALLYKPVDRMTQYSLILNGLLKYTPEDHADHALLSEATANLFDLIEQVNVNRRDRKAPQRQLLKEGTVVELDDGERKARTLFLMSDVLICAKLKPPKDAYVCKWYVSLSDIQLKPFKDSEGSQTVPVTTKAECDKLRATIANIRSDMRRDSMAQTWQQTFDGGSPFTRPKLRKKDSTAIAPTPRASVRGIEKLKKKLQEQERLLQLIAPSIPLNLYHKSGKTYTLLLTSDDDKVLWKEAIAPRIKRMLSRKQGTVHLSHMEIQQALEISLRVQRLGMRFGAAVASPFLFAGRQESIEPDTEEGLTGFLYVHVQNGKNFSKTAENYCVLEVDSYGYFFRKGKTKPAKGPEPQWDEDFEYDVEAASSLRLTSYNCRGRLLGDELSGKVVIDLAKENIADNRCHTFTVVLDRQGAVTLTISYSQSQQGIKRTRTNAAESKVFKVPISAVTRREKFDIPLVVISCIKEIEKRGIDEVGIYRVSGIASEIKSLKTAFDENPQSATLGLSEADINAVAGLVKLYFRELPEPLFTNALYPKFVSGIHMSDPEEKELFMLDTFQQLPKPNKLTALYLFEHLRRVSQKESVNKMGINNLSTVFGPTVLRPSIHEKENNADNLRSGSTFDIGALDVMSQVSVFRFFLGLNSSKTRLPEDDLELWQRLDYKKAAILQEKLMENAVEYLI